MCMACGFLESSPPITPDVNLQNLPSLCFSFFANTPASGFEDPITLDTGIQWAWFVVFFNPGHRLLLM